MKKERGVCYIVGAGDFKNRFTPSEDDLVIAADGGFDHLRRHGIRCDILVGDLDSISEPPCGIKLLRHPVEKDETDMHLSYLEGKRMGYESFILIGGAGGRSDHTFANYCLLYNIALNGDRGIMLDGYTHIHVVKNEKIELTGDKGATFSVFAFGGRADGVSIRNAKYEAECVSLDMDFPLGVSNSFTDEVATVDVADGALLIISNTTSDS